jgi:hypothetical protein
MARKRDEPQPAPVAAPAPAPVPLAPPGPASDLPVSFRTILWIDVGITAVTFFAHFFRGATSGRATDRHLEKLRGRL